MFPVVVATPPHTLPGEFSVVPVSTVLHGLCHTRSCVSSFSTALVYRQAFAAQPARVLMQQQCMQSLRVGCHSCRIQCCTFYISAMTVHFVMVAKQCGNNRFPQAQSFLCIHTAKCNAITGCARLNSTVGHHSHYCSAWIVPYRKLH